MSAIERSWYREGDPLTQLLTPLSWLFSQLVGLRRHLYSRRLLASHRLPVPVVVVGNLTVGGSGKTPLVIALYRLLSAAGYTPGVISRGYGGRSDHWPRVVDGDSDPAEVGDEPVLMARRGVAPLVVAPDRYAAGCKLLQLHPGVDLILSDDGLQHLRLERDIEMVVVDGERRFGNRRLLPAGPLREPIDRLRSVSMVVINGPQPGERGYHLLAGPACRVAEPGHCVPLAPLLQSPLHAVAGIGHPERFFTMLERLGALRVIRHPRPDHHHPTADACHFNDSLPVLMTEKDAVKYRPYARDRHYFVPVEARLDDTVGEQLLARLDPITARHRCGRNLRDQP